MQSYHLTPGQDDWELTREGSDKLLATYASKQEALDGASEIVAHHTGSLKIHLADGTIEEERTYPRSVVPALAPG